MAGICEGCGGPVKTRNARRCRDCAGGRSKPPTPEQIAARSAEIRSEWDATQERNRRGVLAGDDDRLTIPVVRSHQY